MCVWGLTLRGDSVIYAVFQEKLLAVVTPGLWDAPELLQDAYVARIPATR